MSTSKYGKYIITKLKQNINEAAWTPEMRPAKKGAGGRMLWLDSEIVPGAFYVETDWALPRKAGEPFKPGATAHKHDYDEVLCMFGTNMDDPYDLCGEVEFWLEGVRSVMDGTKYGKYIVTQLKPSIAEASWTNPIQAAGKGRGGRVLFLDGEVVPGAFYVEVAFGGPRETKQEPGSVAEPHKHEYDEVLAMFGTNINDPYELNGEVEFWLGDEKHIITKSCLIFIPKGLMHCPLIYRNVKKPIFSFTTHNGKMYA